MRVRVTTPSLGGVSAALIVVLGLLAACGSSTEVQAGAHLTDDSDETVPFDEAFCPRYQALLDNDELPATRQDMDRYRDQVAETRAVAPPDLAQDLVAFEDHLDDFAALIEPYGYDSERFFADLDGVGWAAYEQLYEPVLALFADSDLAWYAHRSCGADDPAFEMGCIDEFASDEGEGAGALADHIDAELGRLPDGSVSHSRSVETTSSAGPLDQIDVAYLDAEGRTVRVTRYRAVDVDRYRVISSRVCSP